MSDDPKIFNFKAVSLHLHFSCNSTILVPGVYFDTVSYKGSNIFLFFVFEKHDVMCYIDVNRLITIDEYRRI